MLAVMIVPTGIGAEIGGHAGDATSAAHLLAACCDRLVLNPNVVNASDFTEQPPNALYVEGAMLDAFLGGEIRLRPVRQNHILVACNEIGRDTVNCVNAVRSLVGVSAEIVRLRRPLVMRGRVDQTKAYGETDGVVELAEQLSRCAYDALAIHTPVDVETEIAEHYIKHGGINPWGGVEALLSKEVYRQTGKPTAHAPVEGRDGYEYGVTDPRLAPEMICAAHLGCVLRGLHRAPRATSSRSAGTLGSEDVDVMVSPLCWGKPHDICRGRQIPMVFVEENDTSQSAAFRERFDESDGYVVGNYVEAAGLLTLMGLGRSLASVRRPLNPARIVF